MILVRWIGQGEGSYVSPFILNVPVDFDLEKPFHIRLENNYTANKRQITYFRFSNSDVKYVLAIVVKDTATAAYYQCRDAIEYTLLLTSRVDYTDGGFITNVHNGVHYILKQQIFTSATLIAHDHYVIHISTTEPVDRQKGDYWFELELQPGQTEDQFLEPTEIFDSDELTTLTENLTTESFPETDFSEPEIETLPEDENTILTEESNESTSNEELLGEETANQY